MPSYSHWFTNIIIDIHLHLVNLHWYTNVINTWTALCHDSNITQIHKCKDLSLRSDYQTICHPNATSPNSLHHPNDYQVHPYTSLCTIMGNLMIPTSKHLLVVCRSLRYSTLEHLCKNVLKTSFYFCKFALLFKIVWCEILYTWGSIVLVFKIVKGSCVWKVVDVIAWKTF